MVQMLPADLEYYTNVKTQVGLTTCGNGQIVNGSGGGVWIAIVVQKLPVDLDLVLYVVCAQGVDSACKKAKSKVITYVKGLTSLAQAIAEVSS